MQKTKTITNEEKVKSAKEPKRKTNSTQSQRLSFLEEEFKKVISSLQKEIKELKEDTLNNAKYLLNLKKEKEQALKAQDEKLLLIQDEFFKELKTQVIDSKTYQSEKELIHKVLEILITHLEKLENKNKSFFSFSKSQLKKELENIKSQNTTTRLNFSLNDD